MDKQKWTWNEVVLGGGKSSLSDDDQKALREADDGAMKKFVKDFEEMANATA